MARDVFASTALPWRRAFFFASALYALKRARELYRPFWQRCDPNDPQPRPDPGGMDAIVPPVLRGLVHTYPSLASIGGASGAECMEKEGARGVGDTARENQTLT